MPVKLKEKTRKITSRDVFLDGPFLGLVIFLMLVLVLFLSQSWGLGAYLFAVTGCLGFLGLYFRIATVLKPTIAFRRQTR
jgi:hypothetical protein